MAGQQIDPDEPATKDEDDTFSQTEEDTETEGNAITDEDNVIPFG
jgi:hypothetical protein